jgi:hypothetical protein
MRFLFVKRCEKLMLPNKSSSTRISILSGEISDLITLRAGYGDIVDFTRSFPANACHA